MSHESLVGVLIIIPFAIIFSIFAIINSSAKKFKVEELRAKINSLPLDEKTKKKRLEMFDKINARIQEYEIKIKYLNQLASGGKVEIKKPLVEYHSYKRKGSKINKRRTLGQVPSGITYQCEFLPASDRSHF